MTKPSVPLLMPGERWRQVAAMPYLVSNIGRVMAMPRRTARGRLTTVRVLSLRPGGSNGHPIASLCGHRHRNVYVHRLVAGAFCAGKSCARKYVDHINGVPTDNRAENLRWVTPSENLCADNRRPRAGKDLPRGIARQGKDSFRVSIYCRTKRFTKSGFKCLADAVTFRDRLFKRIGREPLTDGQRKAS